jgi:hypothetical protein
VTDTQPPRGDATPYRFFAGISTEAQVTTAGTAFVALEAWRQDPTTEAHRAFTDAAAAFMIEYKNQPRTAYIDASALKSVEGVSQAYEYARMSGAQVVELALLLPGEPLVHVRDMIALVTDTIALKLGVTPDELRALITSADPHNLPKSLRPRDP